jgi:hypothetical protein
MDDRAFDDFETTIEAGGRAVPIRVTGSALHGIWGAGVGPQTAQAIFDENRPLFEEVIADKLLAGDVESGVVVIRDVDLDM